MNLRRLLPRRIIGTDGHHRAIFRAGLSSLMSSAVELSSLGKMTTAWRMIAVNMAYDKWELRRFFEAVAESKPYSAHLQYPRGRRQRAEAMAQALAYVATGAVEVLSAGYVSADWYILWRVYGEDIIDKVLERLKPP